MTPPSEDILTPSTPSGAAADASLSVSQTIPAVSQHAMNAGVLFDASPLPIWILDAESFAFLAVNQAAADRYGYTPEAFLGMTLQDVCLREDLPLFKEQLARVPFGFAEHAVLRHRTKAGTVLFVEPARQETEYNGRRAVFTILNDVTDRVRAEDALRASEASLRASRELLETTLRSIGDGVITTDSQGRVTLMNVVAQRLTGWSEGEAQGKEARDIFHIIDETTRVDVENPIERVLREKIAVGLANHTILLSRDGGEVAIDDSAAPIQDAAGACHGAALVFHDVTERRRQERALAESQERTRLIVQTSLDAVVEIDSGNHITGWNRQAEAIFGWSREEAIGKRLTETIIPPKYREAHLKGLEHFVNTGEGPVLNRRIEITACRRNGDEFPVELSITPIKTAQGMTFSAFVRDISERSQADEALQRSEALQRATLESMAEGVVVMDAQGQIVSFNSAFSALHGFHTADEGYADLLNFMQNFTCTGVDRDPIPVNDWPAARALRGETVRDMFLRVRNKNTDAEFVGSYSASPVLEDGRLTAVVITLHDMTDLIAAQEALQQSETQLHAILDNMPVIIYLKDLAGRYLLVNRAFERLNGRTLSEAKGKTDADIFSPRLANALAANDQRVLEVGAPIEFEETGAFQDRPATYLSTKFPLRDGDDAIYALCSVSTDITKRKQEETKRQFLTEATEALASSLDYEKTLQQVADLAVPHIADWCGVDMLEEDGSISQLAVAHVNPERVKWGHELRKRYPPDPSAPRGLPNVLRTGQAEIYSHIPDELLAASAKDAEHLELMRQIGLDSVMIVPMRARDRILGAITFVATDESGHHYTEEDLLLAEGLAARAALAIENARLYRAAQVELTERRRVQEALQKSEERFRFALANSSISVYTQDSDLRYTWVYSGVEGRELTRLYGETDSEFLIAEDAAKLMEIKQRVLRTGVEERQVVRATYRGQEPGYYDTVFAPLRDTEGAIVGVTGTVNDITARKKDQDALMRHQAEIEALNVRLQRSMSETHHRVKNNLQVISALLDMQEMQYEEAVPVTEIARLRQHIQALSTIHDLLTYQAKKDADVYDLSVKEAMDKLVPILRGMVAGRSISVTVEDLKMPVRQSTTFTVLVNELVSNAVKHGEGEIQLFFFTRNGKAVLEVRDRGPGFPAAFDPVTQANTGLELVQTLAKLDLKGEARFENQEEGGARVVVEFPIPSVVRTAGEQ